MEIDKQNCFERACPVCGNRNHVHFSEERIDSKKINEFTYASRKLPEFMCLRLVKCTDCHLVYAPTPPTNDFLEKAYSDSSYDSGFEAQAAAVSYAKVLAPYVACLTGRNAAVDVGTGSGPFLPWLQSIGFNPVIGIEPSRTAIEAAPPAVKPLLREGMFSPALLGDVNLSLFCSFMTLEHLTDPLEFVKSAYDLLDPGGMVAVVVHNWQSPINRLLGLHSPIIDVEHLQLFCPQSVKTLLTTVGFVSVNLQSICNIYPLRYWLRLTPLSASIKTRIISFLDYTGLSDTQISLTVGNILAVGNKPLR
jgi:SAM-dependent methyltransferase